MRERRGCGCRATASATISRIRLLSELLEDGSLRPATEDSLPPLVASDVSSEASEPAPQLGPEPPQPGDPATERLYQLAEIIGARKILLGTVVAASIGETVATCEGLLATLIWEDEGSLLSSEDIAKLELLVRQVLYPSAAKPSPTEEWYQTITRFLNEINSRITVLIVEAVNVHVSLELGEIQATMQVPLPLTKIELSDGMRAGSERITQESPTKCVPLNASTAGCGCRAGLKRLIQSLADLL